MCCRIGFQQHHITIFGGHQEESGIFQQQHLPFAVAAAFPLPFTSFQVDTSENRIIKAVSVVFKHHKVVEVRLQVQ